MTPHKNHLGKDRTKSTNSKNKFYIFGEKSQNMGFTSIWANA